MPRVVGVHGIGQQLQGELQLREAWAPAVADGVTRAGGALATGDVAMAFYGDLFRPSGRSLAVGDPRYTASDVEDGYEQELLLAWWAAAAEVYPQVVPPGERTLIRTPRAVQTGLRILSQVPYFADVALRAMVFDLKQVRRYLTEPGLREQVWKRLDAAVTADTRVLVAHSLGSVAAYEALWHHPQWPVTTLVTIGSPLAIPRLVFERLRPPPDLSGGALPGAGHWPGNAARWTNVADEGDIVALVKDLRPCFGDRVDCHIVHNGSHAHDARPYLSSKEVGAAVWRGLEAADG
ncbi:hypothetical protein GTY41_30975 [Streptomyces sp. SID685]|uniref:hypothetical protein n=1 Tax=Streptomyces sp. SID685 TaxID=2690322 RepID=UPI0013721891|nr:hypothetical protein [Streptomyces sp. SID685]MYR89215.1 hypothetical protein [Streptomyces sp. SID685]